MDSIIKSRLESDLELTASGSADGHAKAAKIEAKFYFQPVEPFTVMENLSDFCLK